MKILESQSATLTNYEVYQHLADRVQANKKKLRRAPGNLESLTRELLQYLRAAPGPLSHSPITYSPECITQLLQRLRPYDLSKGEVIMILNLRPASVAALNTVIEDMRDRFDDYQQEDIVTIIGEVLGQSDAPQPPPNEGDHNPEAENGAK